MVLLLVQLYRKKGPDDTGENIGCINSNIFTVSPQQSSQKVVARKGKDEDDEEEDEDCEEETSVVVVRRQVAPLVSYHYNSYVPKQGNLRKSVCESQPDPVKFQPCSIATNCFVFVNEDCNSGHAQSSTNTNNKCIGRSKTFSTVTTTSPNPGTTFIGYSNAAIAPSSVSLQQQPQKKVVVQLNEKIVVTDDDDDNENDNVDDEEDRQGERQNETVKRKVEGEGKGEAELSPTLILSKTQNASDSCTCSLVSSTTSASLCTLAITNISRSSLLGASTLTPILATTTTSSTYLSPKTCSSTFGSKDCSGLFAKQLSPRIAVTSPKSDNNILTIFEADDKSTQLECAGKT